MEDFKKVDLAFIAKISEDYPCEYDEKFKIACYAWCESDNTFVACDNTTGDAFIEEFKTLVGVTAYLGLSLPYYEAKEFDNMANDAIVHEVLKIIRKD